MIKAEIEYQLEEWARWHFNANGYPSLSAHAITPSGGMGARLPRGVECSQRVGYIVAGIECARNLGMGDEINAMSAWYLRRHGERYQDLAKRLDMSPAVFREARRRLETWLTGYVAACEQAAPAGID